ncbi:MAG: hypothetical protein WDM94_12010 [Bauldia sp.]
MRAILAAALISLMPAAALAADDALLAKLVGEWTGRGMIVVKPGSDPERVFCKLTNTLKDDGKTLDQKGRCSLASSSGRIDGEIRADGGGKYSGTLASLASRGPASLAGTGNASRLDLNASFIDTLTGQPDTSVNTIEVLPGGYRLSTVRKDPRTGASYASSTITFSAD